MTNPAVRLFKSMGLVTAFALLFSLFQVPAAQADTAPPDPLTPVTVAADALPTVQIDGVAWTQRVIGNTVYVGGNFTTARPAGAAAGVNTTPRANLLAYDITTGNLITTWDVSTNGEVLSIVPSPDNSILYIGGSFTTVNGQIRNRIAAVNRATGVLVNAFQPKPDATVRAIVATSTTVYFGGLLTSVGGVARTRVAAVSSATGALLSWAPNAQGGSVHSLALSPTGDRLVIGGSFTTMNGSGNPGYGLASIDPATGASQPMPANTRIRNGGANSAITTLSSDGESLYVSGFVFGAGGNLEGISRLSWADFSITWLADCHGDTYSTFPKGDIIYASSHAHYCGNLTNGDGFPQLTPSLGHYATAFTKAVTGVLSKDPLGYPNWQGLPSPSLLKWFPLLANGTFTGQGQASWNVAGNDSYLTYGGEFPKANNVAQQGLVRFAVKSLAPNKVAPEFSLSKINPSLLSMPDGSIKLSWRANWDRDNELLTYKVIRDGITATPIYTTTQLSSEWNRPNMGYIDKGDVGKPLVPGQSYRYRVFVSDPLGNENRSDTVTITASSPVARSTYASDVITDGAANYWRLGEPSGTTAFDSAGFGDATAQAGVTRGAAGAVPTDADKASTFDGSATGVVAHADGQPGPNTYTTEAWFKTTTTRGGKIIGYGNVPSGTSTSFDRHVYMTNTGQLVYGVNSGGVKTLATPTTKAYNDGQWHQVVASLGAGGMTLSVDGAKIVGRTDVTTGQAFRGLWRIGGDNLANWTSRPLSDYFSGTIDEVAVYPTVLTAAQITKHYTDAKVANAAPVAAFTFDATQPTVTFDGSTSTDSDGTVASYAWDFGDGSTGTGATTSHAYATAGTFQAKLTVTDNAGATGTITKAVTAVGPPANVNPTAAFTSTVTQLSAAFDSTGSADSDGTIVSYAWDFGDSTTGTGSTANHTYTTAGDYVVKLTVTDNSGGTGFITHTVTAVAPPANVNPTAAFTSTVTQLSAAFDSTGSADSDGTIASYAWDFGDSTTGTGSTANHTYTTAGDYVVKLTVTDNSGGTGFITHTVTAVAPPANVNPTAAFTSTVTQLSAAFDSTGSADSDGTIASYAWDFGDSTTGTGATANHTYTTAGDYVVKLTVTDNAGGTDFVTHTVTAVAAPAGPLASDTFGRTSASGWGTAVDGGAWATYGTASTVTVGGGVGKMSLVKANAGVRTALDSVSSTNTDVTAKVSLDKLASPAGSSVFVSVGARTITTSDYRAKVKIDSTGVLTLYVTKVVANAETTLSSVQLPSAQNYAVGQTLQVRVQAFGTSPTTVRAKVWKTTATEPAAWTLSSTDTTASLQAPGGVGIVTFLSSTATNFPIVVSVDDLLAVPAN